MPIRALTSPDMSVTFDQARAARGAAVRHVGSDTLVAAAQGTVTLVELGGR